MTVPPGMPDDDASRRSQRRFVWASAAIVVLIVVLLGIGLKASMDARSALCPPGNPNCGPTPPGPAPTTQPMALPTNAPPPR